MFKLNLDRRISSVNFKEGFKYLKVFPKEGLKIGYKYHKLAQNKPFGVLYLKLKVRCNDFYQSILK